MTDQRLELTRTGVDVLDSIEGTILPDIVSWELVSAWYACLQRHRVMHPVEILLSPHAHVSDKSVVIVTLWAWYCTSAIEFYSFNQNYQVLK